eukprot:7170605-Pyramimonas_sp.AAC.1
MIIVRTIMWPRSAWGGLVSPPCGRRHWGRMWSPVWGHDACEGRAEMVRRRHADGAAGTLCGAPYGAT